MYPEALVIDPMKINKIPKGKEHMFPSLCESGEYFAQLKKGEDRISVSAASDVSSM